MRKKIALCILVLSVTCAPVWADIRFGATTATRDILLFEEGNVDELEAIKVEEVFQYDFVTSLTVDRENGIYSTMDSIVMTFKSDEDCYLTILNFTPSGQILVLFPNQWVQDNNVKAGQEVNVPTEGQGFSMRAGNVVGVDVVRAIATNKVVPILDPDNKELLGPFAKLQDPRAGTRDILLFAEDPDPEPGDVPLRWSVASLAIATQGDDGLPTGFASAKNEANSAKMWTNKPEYLKGERVFVRLMSDKPAALTSLVNLGASTNENVLLPEGEEIYLNPGEILVLPRSNDTWRLVAASDEGKDIVKGVLTFDDDSELELSLEVLVKADDD